MVSTITFAAIIGALTVVVGILVKVLGFPHQFMKNYKRKSTEGYSTVFILLAFLAMFYGQFMVYYKMIWY